MEAYQLSEDYSVYYITYTVVDWLPVFISDGSCRIILNSLNFCHEKLGLRINAYVIMPTHIHAIVFDRDYQVKRLGETLFAFRKHTGRALADYCAEHLPQCFTQTFRKAAGPDRQRRFWQPTRHPVGVYSQPFWQQKVDYLHDNPRRKGLVLYAEQWRFSSIRFHLGEKEEEELVKLTHLEW